METFREHTTQKALTRISDRHSNNVGRNFGFDHNYLSIRVGGKGTNESCTILCEHIQYFIFWKDSETSVRPISFTAFHFLFIILKSRQLRAPVAEI